MHANQTDTEEGASDDNTATSKTMAEGWSRHLGERVVVKLDGESKLGTTGTVQQPHTTPRSYLTQTNRGTLRRNRRHLRPTFHPVQQPDKTESMQASEQPSSPLCSHPDSPIRETVPAEPGGHAQARVTSSGRVIRPPDRFKDFVCT